MTDADLALAEAEYELKQAEKKPEVRQIEIDYANTSLAVARRELEILEETNKMHPGAISVLEIEKAKSKVLEKFMQPGTPSPPRKAERELTFQGKTFEQWVEELKTELDPKLRAEAFRAFAMFGANGRGKEATAVIVDAVKNISFQRMGAGPPIEEMKGAAMAAFADEAIHIPFGDSMPVLLKNFGEGTPNERDFAAQVFQMLRVFYRAKPEALKEFQPKMIDLLKRWEPDEFGDRRFQSLFNLVNDVFPGNGNDVAAEMIREAVENEDEKRFTALFAGFEPMKMAAPSFFKGSNTVCLFGIYPDVAEPDRGTNPTNLKPDDLKHFHMTPFGKSLLKLLQEKGVTAKNETIRETSAKIVEALLSIDRKTTDQQ